MAKKVKPTNLLDEESKPENVQEAIENSSVESIFGNGRLTNEDKEKLEKYDAMESTIIELTRDKQVLESKIAEYVEKLESIKKSDESIEKLKNENTMLKKQLEEAKSSPKSNLEIECKKLRDEADGYLMRISELTFENANLTCQLNEIKNQSRTNYSRQQPTTLARPRVDPYNPYKNNGYGSW